MNLPQDIAAKVQASFARQSLMTAFDAEILILESGLVTISAPISQTVLQQHGAAHAGLTFALGDTAAGYSALTVIEGDSDVMTAEMKINLLRPGMGDRLVAEGRVLKPGRRLIVVQADIYSESGDTRTHIAAMQGTMVPV